MKYKIVCNCMQLPEAMLSLTHNFSLDNLWILSGQREFMNTNSQFLFNILLSKFVSWTL